MTRGRHGGTVPWVRRVANALARAADDDGPLLVAVSGGRDSMTLLHLARFSARLEGGRVEAAHFDHAMRPGSAGDAAWVAGVCRAWGVPLHQGRAIRAPANEGEARTLRYDFLHQARRRAGAGWLLTAHHADDQAETVLLRIVRGTGLQGLGGMRERRRPGVWRPLLNVEGSDIARYARQTGLTWREDPTNRSVLPRNVIRHEVIPRVVEAVAPGASANLRALARHAREDETAWASLMPELLAPLDPEEADGAVSFLRGPLLARAPQLQVRLLRALARRVAPPLSRVGTRAAAEFSRTGTSGGGVDLGGGLVLRRDLDRLIFQVREADLPEETLRIPSKEGGRGSVRIGNHTWVVEWGGEEEGGAFSTFLGSPGYPLAVRGWRPGDRVALPYGRKKVKKVFLEARVPVGVRRRTPVVTDAEGRILWIPGIVRSVEAEPVSGHDRLHIRVAHAPDD